MKIKWPVWSYVYDIVKWQELRCSRCGSFSMVIHYHWALVLSLGNLHLMSLPPFPEMSSSCIEKAGNPGFTYETHLHQASGGILGHKEARPDRIAFWNRHTVSRGGRSWPLSAQWWWRGLPQTISLVWFGASFISWLHSLRTWFLACLELSEVP